MTHNNNDSIQLIFDTKKVQAYLASRKQIELLSLILVILITIPVIIFIDFIIDREISLIQQTFFILLIIISYVALLINTILAVLRNINSNHFYDLLVKKNVVNKLILGDDAIIYPTVIFSETLKPNNSNNTIPYTLIQNIAIWINVTNRSKEIIFIIKDKEQLSSFIISQDLLSNPIESIADFFSIRALPVYVLVARNNVNKIENVLKAKFYLSTERKHPFNIIKYQIHDIGKRYESFE